MTCYQSLLLWFFLACGCMCTSKPYAVSIPRSYCMAAPSQAWTVVQVWLTVTLSDWTAGDSRNSETNFAKELWQMLYYSPPRSAWEENKWMLCLTLIVVFIHIFICKLFNSYICSYISLAASGPDQLHALMHSSHSPPQFKPAPCPSPPTRSLGF